MADENDPAVRLRGATKRYGTVTALDGVSLDIRRGEVFALLGPNGAGKTTLISLVAGTARPTAGSVQVLGHDVLRDYQFTRRAVGLVPQEINFDPFFTVEEALRFQAGYFGVRLSDDRLEEILAALGLLEKRSTNTRALSGGMKRRLLIAKALVHRPPVLFLDEPTAGVDVELRRDLWGYVQRLSAAGTTIVLTTHYLEEAEELAERIGVIKNGRLLVVEEKSALLARYGHRSVRLALEAPLAALPAPLLSAGATLADGGRTVVFTPSVGENLAPALQEVARAGLRIADVQTREPRLETVIVELLRAGAPAHDASADPSATANPTLTRNATSHTNATSTSTSTPNSTPNSNSTPTPNSTPNSTSSPTANPALTASVGAASRYPPWAHEPIHPTLGVRTLFRKEVKRFLRVPGQTILSPLITTALYFLVFGWSLGGRLREVSGVPYSRFLVPGLVMLGIINNSFLNTSSSLFIMKLQGTIVDLLVTPLSYFEVLAAFVAAGCARALLVGALTWITAALFVGPSLPHLWLALAAAILVAVAFAACGLIVALWADKFEQVNFIPTFVITPLTFLGGVFYSATMLPPSLRRFLHVNPIYFMIESMRFALTGKADVSPAIGIVLLAVLAAAMSALALDLLRRGYKLRD